MNVEKYGIKLFMFFIREIGVISEFMCGKRNINYFYLGFFYLIESFFE